MPAGPDLSTSQPACAICPSPRTRRQAGAPKTQGGAPAPHRRRPPSELVTKHPGAPCRSPGPRKSQRVVRMASTFLFHFPAGRRAMTDLMSCNFCFPRQQRLRQLKRQKSQGPRGRLSDQLLPYQDYLPLRCGARLCRAWPHRPAPDTQLDMNAQPGEVSREAAGGPLVRSRNVRIPPRGAGVLGEKLQNKGVIKMRWRRVVEGAGVGSSGCTGGGH